MVDTPAADNDKQQSDGDLKQVRPAPEPPESTQANDKQEQPKDQRCYSKDGMRVLKAMGQGIIAAINWVNSKGPLVAAMAAVAIAVLTWRYVHYSRAQWTVMGGQLTEMQAAHQPWLGLENNSIGVGQSPIWGAPPHHTTIFFDPKESFSITNLYVSASYAVKNFGNGPAFHEKDVLMALSETDSSVPPTDQINLACSRAEALGSIPGAANPGAGAVIFPAEAVQTVQSTNLRPASNQTHFGNIWFFLCIAYRDQAKGIHHTRYWYRSFSQDPTVSSPIPRRPEWSYTPLAGASMWGEDAD